MRHYIRHPMDIPVAIEMTPDEHNIPGKLTNLGHGGLCIRSTQSYDKGDIIQINIPALFMKEPFRGRVQWCTNTEGFIEVGVEFLSEKEAYRARMVEQVCHIKHYQKEIEFQEGRRLNDEQAAKEWVAKYADRFIL